MLNYFYRIAHSLSRKYVTLVWNLRLNTVGEDTLFDTGIHIYNPQNIRFGKNCVINNGVILQSCEKGEIIVGNDVTISYNSILLTCGLVLDRYQEEKKHFSKNITIEDKVWIGANVTILPGVTISSGTIVAAGSVVTKNIEANVVIAGVPAKVIKKLDI